MIRAKLCVQISTHLFRWDARSLPFFCQFHGTPDSPVLPALHPDSRSQFSSGFRIFEQPSYVHHLKFPGKSLFSQSSAANCWSCGSVLQSRPALVCESCGVIQPVDHSVDYFQIFGLDKKYDVEEGSLDGKFKDWQKKLHPDLVHSKPQRERGYAAEQSARVIDACRTLKNPLQRAIYLMTLQGIIFDEEQTIFEPQLLAECSFLDKHHHPLIMTCSNLPPIRIMEIREAVEEANDPETLKQLQSQVSGKLKHWSNYFSVCFQSRNTEEALNSIRRMKYYVRVNEEINKKL